MNPSPGGGWGIYQPSDRVKKDFRWFEIYLTNKVITSCRRPYVWRATISWPAGPIWRQLLGVDQRERRHEGRPLASFDQYLSHFSSPKKIFRRLRLNAEISTRFYAAHQTLQCPRTCSLTTRANEFHPIIRDEIQKQGTYWPSLLKEKLGFWLLRVGLDRSGNML